MSFGFIGSLPIRTLGQPNVQLEPFKWGFGESTTNIYGSPAG
jgi:hypothetical protein